VGPSASAKRTIRYYLIAISLFDVVGSMTSILGTVLLGSGLYQICYSSVLVSSALLSRIILGRVITWTQWIGIITITIGLIASAMGSNLSQDGTDRTAMILGNLFSSHPCLVLWITDQFSSVMGVIKASCLHLAMH
jgi:drug/metabolite transporter (DMT)-like permease